jgi:hypothetical protein
MGRAFVDVTGQLKIPPEQKVERVTYRKIPEECNPMTILILNEARVGGILETIL